MDQQCKKVLITLRIFDAQKGFERTAIEFGAILPQQAPHGKRVQAGILRKAFERRIDMFEHAMFDHAGFGRGYPARLRRYGPI